MGFPYRLIRSDRKTIGMEWKDGGLIVRAPRACPDARIDAFLAEHRDWIAKREQEQRQRDAELAALPPLTQEDLCLLRAHAKDAITKRVAYYAPLIGVTYGRITIRLQKTRWGSCTAEGNLNFNALLLLAPPDVLDSVVVHELCHRKEMNHSKRFYAEVLRVFPRYRAAQKWLKAHGAALLQRAG